MEVKLDYHLDLKKSFSNKKVFITGHTGFKGSWLAFILYKAGADVVGYALEPSLDKNHYNFLALKNKIKHISGDVRDLDLLKKSIHEHRPDFVFHLAAQALVRYSYQDPLSTYSTNIIGSLNVLESVKSCDSIRSLIYVTSDKCYENLEIERGYSENDLLGGRDPYSSSKACAEILFSSYFRSFLSERNHFAAASVRAGNVIGGGDWSPDRIIPDCIRAIESNKPIKIRNPKATRPWQHVLEPLSGYLLLASKQYNDSISFNGAWNFGPNQNEVMSVKEVAELIIKNIGKGRVVKEESSKNVHEAQLLQLNCDKAKNKLMWLPKWSSSQAIIATAEWYKGIMESKDPEALTSKQIFDYFPELNDD